MGFSVDALQEIEVEAERWMTIVEGGGAAIEYTNGKVYCTGSGWELCRCIAGPRDARPAGDPTCAGLLQR